MDRLQEAIRKARNERASRQAEPLQRPEAQQPVATEDRDDHWDSLPELQLDQHLIVRNRLIAYHGGAEARPLRYVADQDAAATSVQWLAAHSSDIPLQRVRQKHGGRQSGLQSEPAEGSAYDRHRF